MEYLKDLYKYNKKAILIGLISLLVVTCVIVAFVNKEPNNTVEEKKEDTYNLVLFGDIDVIVYQNEKYQEFGYYALKNSELLTGEVVVSNNVDTTKLGTYQITYTFYQIQKTRTVKVIENPNDSIEDIELVLTGDSKITLFVGDTYNELGCVAYDKDKNNISNRISISGRVDTSVVGLYSMTYTILENGKEKKLTREIEVIEPLGLTINYLKDYTSENLIVSVTATGTNFSYIRFPNVTVSKDKVATYTISENGEYSFYVYDEDGNYEVETVKITNIDKTLPDGTCTAKSYQDRTEVVVSATDNVAIDRYVFNNNYVSTNAKYTISSKQSSVLVSVYDKAGNKKDINCKVETGLIEIHFIAGVSDDDAILIRTSDKTIMIDGGQWKARAKIVKYLQDLGVTKIDALIGSHVHWNHVQAQAAIIENFQVEKAYYSVDIFNCVSKSQCVSKDVLYIKDKLKEKNISTSILKASDYLEIGEMKLYFIGPTRGKLTTFQNANSLVFILQYGTNKFMFTGDTPDDYMTASKFQSYASNFNMNIDIDVLKWPHHGYETLTDSFFKATTPKYAIIPNCCWCSSKYPGSTNKSLMKKYGTTYYQVCDSKNIVLLSDGENITIKTKQQASDYKR